MQTTATRTGGSAGLEHVLDGRVHLAHQKSEVGFRPQKLLHQLVRLHLLVQLLLLPLAIYGAGLNFHPIPPPIILIGQHQIPLAHFTGQL